MFEDGRLASADCSVPASFPRGESLPGPFDNTKKRYSPRDVRGLGS